MDPSLQKFGAFIVRNLRDKVFFGLEMILGGECTAEDLQELQGSIARLNEADRKTLCDLVEELTTIGLHDLLFALQEEADNDGAIRVLVDGKEVAKLSHGLHGEIFGDDGWIARFSDYPSEAQARLSRQAEEWIQQRFGGDANEEDG